ncbi:4Fe-4S dicluster domain-containing protein [Amaricoccus solimangrovi]|uniref:4Fe-4S dicluster domain-containing protein n=1 Tax=Amaricoccus solimangrovi TaxID=2589815 RepID=A0A501WUJ9_9RHOB|nr:4Fe-4S dicluster domain-containing protein [Amaricoccus solimangrovi]TPE51057.1 4Fe-4S dicluster domain-containing protein [Amaricoccus solimangrovi]
MSAPRPPLWRALDADPSEARAAREFPALAALPPVERRDVLRLMGASLALAGLSGCDWGPDETAMPYVTVPEGEVVGEPRFYASAALMAGYAMPLIGRTYSGRPVKLEGNPDHPEWRGATDVFLQAALLDLYDPDRSRTPRRQDRPADWAAFDTMLADLRRRLDAEGGAGFALLSGEVTSPTLLRQFAALAARWPRARRFTHEPLGDAPRREAAARAFGRPLATRVDLARAEVVVSLGHDLLGPGPEQAVTARGWAERRRAWRAGAGAARLFAAEAAPTQTGAFAERRLVAEPDRLPALARGLAAALNGAGAEDGLSEAEAAWARAAAAALAARPGRGLVTAGPEAPAEVQALAMILTARLGGLGATLRVTEPVAPSGESLAALTEAAEAGEITTLLVLDANPLFTTPGADPFRAAFERVPLRIHLGTHRDETAVECQWHAPLTHPLESWGDARSRDGTVSIIQPLVRPLGGGRAPAEMLARLLGETETDARAATRATWREPWGAAFETRWTEALTRGFVAGTAVPELRPVPLDPPLMPDRPAAALTLVARPHPSVWDGRFANNGWLQETPAPLDKVTWGGVIAISPALAEEKGIATGDELRLTAGDRRMTGPAWIAPGQARGTVAVTLGHGRRVGGQVAAEVGADAFALLPPDGARVFALDGIEKTGARVTVATTQAHQAMEGHDFVRLTDRGAPLPPEPARASFYDPPKPSPGWGMSIDLDACIGCNACLVACVAENNIPVVGKDLVAQGREMHWLRVDRYHAGEPADPATYFQPVPCMHCAQAPCEMGCPVNATVHDAEGLNLQVYNRCIGTRTCSSFCPYKVRRFNWFDLTGDDPPEIRAMRNPEVTVRARGVMEKCTYCVQRISAARIAAKKEDRPIRDGEVVTACQAACPTEAITFGDMSDPETAVSRAKASGRDYPLIPEANTRPSTTYLARVRPDPEESA